LHDALAERRAPFTARELEVGGVLAPGAIEHRVLRLDLLRGEPLPAAEVDLAKLGHEQHGRATAEQRGALPRALQRARRDDLEHLGREPAARGAYLRAALVRERDVAAAVEALARIANGVAVAEQDDASQTVHESLRRERSIAPRGAGVN